MKLFEIQTTIATKVIAKNEQDALALIKNPKDSILSITDEQKTYAVLGCKDLTRSEKVVRDEIEAAIKQIIKEDIGECGNFDLSTPVDQIAKNPLDILQLILGIEDLYQMCIPPRMDTDFSKMTFGNVVDYVYGSLKYVG